MDHFTNTLANYQLSKEKQRLTFMSSRFELVLRKDNEKVFFLLHGKEKKENFALKGFYRDEKIEFDKTCLTWQKSDCEEISLVNLLNNLFCFMRLKPSDRH